MDFPIEVKATTTRRGDDIVNLLEDEKVAINRAAFRIDEYTTVEEVHILFEMLKCSKVFVHSYGALVGVISRRALYFRLHYILAV